MSSSQTRNHKSGNGKTKMEPVGEIKDLQDKIDLLTEELRRKDEELEIQKEELRAQKEELAAQKGGLESQNQELKANNEDLEKEITERKRAEEALNASNRRINEILESIQDDFYVLDRDWNFVFTSKTFTSRIGKEPKDFVGNNIWEMFPKHLGTVLEKNYRAAMEQREIRRFELHGQYTDSWYRMTVFPSAEGITILGTDITERKQAEEKIDQLNKDLNRRVTELQTLFEVLPISISISEDTECKTMYANKVFENLVRVPDGSNISQSAPVDERPSFKAFLNGREIPTEELPMQKAAATGKPVMGASFDAVCADGRVINFYGHAVPLFDEEGKPRGAIGVFDDMTERKRADETRSHLASIVESSKDAIISKTLDGIITSWNQGAEHVYGYRSDEVIGKSVSIFAPPDRPDETRQILKRSGTAKVLFITILSVSGRMGRCSTYP